MTTEEAVDRFIRNEFYLFGGCWDCYGERKHEPGSLFCGPCRRRRESRKLRKAARKEVTCDAQNP